MNCDHGVHISRWCVQCEEGWNPVEEPKVTEHSILNVVVWSAVLFVVAAIAGWIVGSRTR